LLANGFKKLSALSQWAQRARVCVGPKFHNHGGSQADALTNRRIMRLGRGRFTGFLRVLALAGFTLLLQNVQVHASVAFLMEEPYGRFGAFIPSGHAAIYLDHVCAESPTKLRLCHEGEHGVVISRYFMIARYDWIAVPLVPYLYSVSTVAEIPATVDKAKVADLRNAYRRDHLRAQIPDNATIEAFGWSWKDLVGSSFDRKIYGFQLETTTEQDEHLIAFLNDRKNVSHFNLFFHNCADFSRLVLNLYFPHAIRRNYIADGGITTPKQVARSLTKYGKKHPELKASTFVISQVPGTLPRSHNVNGVAESLVRSKKYLIPLAVMQPEATGGIAVAYLITGRFHPPKDAKVFTLKGTDSPAVSVSSAVISPTEISGSTPLQSAEDTIYH